MQRSSARTAVVLVVCFLVGIGVVLLLTGGDDDPTPVATGTATTPAETSPSRTTATTSSKTRTQPGTKTTTPQQPPPQQATAPLETSPEELTKQARARAAAAKARGARTCPNLSKPARAIDITAQKVSCATARKVIFATSPATRNGFRCDIVAESFSDVPAIEYSCKRRADAARIGYTAVG